MNKQTNRYQFRFLFSFIIYVFFFRYVLVYGRIWIENQKNNINDIIDKPDIDIQLLFRREYHTTNKTKKKQWIYFRILSSIYYMKISYDSDNLVSRCTSDTTRCLEFYEFGVYVLLSAGNGAEVNCLRIQGL